MSSNCARWLNRSSPLVVRRNCSHRPPPPRGLSPSSGWSVGRAALRPNTIFTDCCSSVCPCFTLFNARKKLPFFPLVKAATWLQIHIYARWFCLFFSSSTSVSHPSGAFEIVLALVFGIVVLSGFFGLYISRDLPPRMARSGEPLLYERIPAFRLRIQGRSRSSLGKRSARRSRRR